MIPPPSTLWFHLKTSEIKEGLKTRVLALDYPHTSLYSTVPQLSSCILFFWLCGLWDLSFLIRRTQWHPTPVLLPGKSHRWRSLVGCSPWGHQESDMTERLHFHFSLSCIGGGNGNPLQCSCLENSVDRGAWQATVHGITKSQRQLTLFSCLENPRDGGAWWAAVYGVAQSRTRLKRLSSSSSSFLIRARTQAPAVRALNPKHWITGEFPPNY